jgi:ABC-type Mn2+/Zn2+ transport system permease subunit
MMTPRKIQLCLGMLLSSAAGILVGYFSGDLQSHPLVTIECPPPAEARHWAWGLWTAAMVVLPFLSEKPHRFREAALPIIFSVTFALAYMWLQRSSQDVKVKAILDVSQKPILFEFDSFSTDTFPLKWLILLIFLAVYFRFNRPEERPRRRQK